MLWRRQLKSREGWQLVLCQSWWESLGGEATPASQNLGSPSLPCSVRLGLGQAGHQLLHLSTWTSFHVCAGLVSPWPWASGNYKQLGEGSDGPAVWEQDRRVGDQRKARLRKDPASWVSVPARTHLCLLVHPKLRAPVPAQPGWFRAHAAFWAPPLPQAVLPGFLLRGACTCLPLSQPGLPHLGLRPFPAVPLQQPRWGDVAELWWEGGVPLPA